VVANIPYHITSNLIRRLIESPTPPGFLVLTIQKEVAERLVADPGDMSLLALGVQIYGEPEIKAQINAGSFYPRPNVDSAVIRIDFPARGERPEGLVSVVFQLASAAFQQKRKQLANSLSAGLGSDKAHVVEILEKAGISPRKRPQALSVSDWVRLARGFQMAESPRSAPRSGEIDPGESGGDA
jgi:16S rRNA (adenine1518-N6/adenine1519-N6)-dimethyltransferase